MVDKGASDLHITAGSPPRLRIDGELVKLQTEPLTPVDTKQLCYSVLTDAQKLRVRGGPRARLLVRHARPRALPRERLHAAGVRRRRVPRRSRSRSSRFEELGLPPVVAELCEQAARPRARHRADGLGQVDDARVDDRQASTREMRGHIITVEDPIEFQHAHKSCVVNQREIGARHASRSSARSSTSCARIPTSSSIGEMRDLETIEAALTIAETGHLVLRHAAHEQRDPERSTASSTCSRRTSSRRSARELSFVLEGVVTQPLIPKASGPGRALAAEVMVPNAAIRNLIREDKLHQIYSQMQIGQAKFGMQTMNQSLCDLCIRKSRSRSSEALESHERGRRAEDDDPERRAARSATRRAARPVSAGAEETTMAKFAWEGTTRAGEKRKGAMEAESRPRSSRTGCARDGITIVEGQEEGQATSTIKLRFAASRRRISSDLHAPARDDDRRRSAARAVPRHPREPDAEQDLPEDPRRASRARVEQGVDVLRRAQEAPEGVRRALRQPRRGRRGRRHPRHDPEPPRDLHREGGQAEGQIKSAMVYPIGILSSRSRRHRAAC